jgi:hypothetical protein
VSNDLEGQEVEDGAVIGLSSHEMHSFSLDHGLLFAKCWKCWKCWLTIDLTQLEAHKREVCPGEPIYGVTTP